MTSKASSSKRKSPGGKRAQNKSTAKKGKTAYVFSNSGTPELDITEGDMEIYRAIQAKLKGGKRAAAASHDEGKLFFKSLRSVLVHTYFSNSPTEQKPTGGRNQWR